MTMDTNKLKQKSRKAAVLFLINQLKIRFGRDVCIQQNREFVSADNLHCLLFSRMNWQVGLITASLMEYLSVYEGR